MGKMEQGLNSFAHDILPVLKLRFSYTALKLTKTFSLRPCHVIYIYLNSNWFTHVDFNPA